MQSLGQVNGGLLNLVIQKDTLLPTETKIPPPPPPYPPKEEWPSDPKAFAGRLAFYTITKNLKKPAIEAIKNSGNNPQKMAELTEALATNNLSHPLFQDHEAYPAVALCAVREGKITSEQFATLMLRRAAILEHGSVVEIPMFINGQVNPEAKEFIKQTLKVNPKATQEVFDKQTEFLSEEALQQFFEKMKEKPLSEQRFFHVPDNQPRQDKPTTDGYEQLRDIIDGKLTISQGVMVGSGFNVFARFRSNNGHEARRMVPSAAMMQTFLDVKFGVKNSVKLNYVLGGSPLEAIVKNGLSGTREFGLPFPGLPLPPRADDFIAPGFDFPWHDFYHAFVASAVPDTHRMTFCQLAETVKALASQEKFKSYSSFLEAWSETLIDMEHLGYQPNSQTGRLDPSTIFWMQLSGTVIKTKSALNIKAMVKEGSTLVMRESFVGGHKEEKAIKRVFKELFKNRDSLEELAGIKFNAVYKGASETDKLLTKALENDMGYVLAKFSGNHGRYLEPFHPMHPIYKWQKNYDRYLHPQFYGKMPKADVIPIAGLSA